MGESELFSKEQVLEGYFDMELRMRKKNLEEAIVENCDEKQREEVKSAYRRWIELVVTNCYVQGKVSNGLLYASVYHYANK